MRFLKVNLLCNSASHRVNRNVLNVRCHTRTFGCNMFYSFVLIVDFTKNVIQRLTAQEKGVRYARVAPGNVAH